MPFGRLNGFVFALLLFLSSFLGSIFMLIPFLPLAFFAPRLWRFCADRLIGYWLVFPASMIFFMFRVQLRVTGDVIDRSKPALIIMNHRTRLDWLWFWNALYKMDPWLLTTEKISLKAGLKNIPGAGWAMSCNSYIFFNRKLSMDQQVMDTMVKYYKDTKINYQLLFFPEGTDRGARATEISHKFADDNKLERYDYCLHPRTTGFNHLVDQLRKIEYIFDVYDVTIGYPDRIIASEFDLLKNGEFPKQVHFDVKRYTVEEVTGGETDKNKFVDTSKWLTDLWRHKEDRLKRFYEQDREFVPSGVGYVWPVDRFVFAYYVAFAFWFILMIVWLYLVYVNYWAKLYCLFGILFFSYGQYVKGGLEFLFLEWFYGKRTPMAEPKVITETTLLEKIRGWIYVLTMLISALFGTIYILMPMKLLIFIRPRLYRQIVDRLVGFWLCMPSGLMEYAFGVQMRVTGTAIDRTKPALIIMNHRTRLDWLFFWNALFRIDPMLLTSEKISLKGILKHVPGAGWAMACQAYIFLARSFEKDEKHINNMIDYYANSGQSYQLLLFVEGTDKCPLATGRSKAYAEKMNLVHYDYLLHPRITGFAHIVQKMRQCDYLENIYDVTLAYPNEIVQSEVDLAKLGACPTKIHFDVRQIDPKSLPENDVEIGQWLTNLWAEKEERLKSFYDMPMEKRQFDSLPGDVEFKLSRRSFWVQMLIVSIWTVMTILWCYVFFTFAYQYFLGFLTLLFFVGCAFFYDGLENLLAIQLKQPSLGHLFGAEHKKKA
ncbi:Acl-9 [Aphelenchoides besseyi]|nr:Acl-9 [Aphelenchoides besseyi]KAI6199981.1 Acl-9 [Aphelenchoides besseyi]